MFACPSHPASPHVSVVAIIVLIGIFGLSLTGCRNEETPPVRSEATLAVEEKAGDFLDYYEKVLLLARDLSAEPDSFRAALDSLPGSHLTEEEWRHWTEPYRNDSPQVAERLEDVIARMSSRN